MKAFGILCCAAALLSIAATADARDRKSGGHGKGCDRGGWNSASNKDSSGKSRKWNHHGRRYGLGLWGGRGGCYFDPYPMGRTGYHRPFNGYRGAPKSFSGAANGNVFSN